MQNYYFQEKFGKHKIHLKRNKYYLSFLSHILLCLTQDHCTQLNRHSKDKAGSYIWPPRHQSSLCDCFCHYCCFACWPRSAWPPPRTPAPPSNRPGRRSTAVVAAGAGGDGAGRGAEVGAEEGEEAAAPGELGTILVCRLPFS